MLVSSDLGDLYFPRLGPQKATDGALLRGIGLLSRTDQVQLFLV